jgi:serine/threonine protein kinase
MGLHDTPMQSQAGKSSQFQMPLKPISNYKYRPYSHQIKPIRLVHAKENGKHAMDVLVLSRNSPWETYEAISTLQLGHNRPFVIAERKGISTELFNIQQCTTITDKQMKMFEVIQHPNIMTVHEVYQFHDEYFLALDFMPRSLQEMVGNPYINSKRLAAIAGQVSSLRPHSKNMLNRNLKILRALAYLESKGLQHGQLTCSYILIHPSGKVKLCSSGYFS